MKGNLVSILCKAIEQRRLVRFYYVSESGKKGWRKVQPYIVGVKENGNTFLAALPLEELKKEIGKRKTGHYLIEKIDIDKLEVLSETFSEPNVDRKRVTDTPSIQVICRFRYNNEIDGEYSLN
jgi:hypothetical protein